MRWFWKECQVSTSSLATRESMRCTFHLQRTYGQSMFHRSCSSRICSSRLFHAVDNKRTLFFCCHLLPTPSHSHPFLLPSILCTASPKLTPSSPFQVNLQSNRPVKNLDRKPWAILLLPNNSFCTVASALLVPPQIISIDQEIKMMSYFVEPVEAVSSMVLDTMDICGSSPDPSLFLESRSNEQRFVAWSAMICQHSSEAQRGGS